MPIVIDGLENPNAIQQTVDAIRAMHCHYCAMGAPTFRDTDNMICHRVASNQAVERGNDPHFAANI